MAVTIAEFLASVGFQADEASLKGALAKVTGFAAGITLAAGIISTVGIGGYLRMPKNDINTGHADVFRTSTAMPMRMPSKPLSWTFQPLFLFGGVGVGVCGVSDMNQRRAGLRV